MTRKPSAEEHHARQLAGPDNQTALETIAAHLHYNESIHMHDLNGQPGRPCGYCWLRAGKAIHALRHSRLHLILAPATTPATEPIELDAAVLQVLHADGKGAHSRGWTVVGSFLANGNYQSRHLVISNEDGQHYAAPFASLDITPADARVTCRPVMPAYEVTQSASYTFVDEAEVPA